MLRVKHEFKEKALSLKEFTRAGDVQWQKHLELSNQIGRIFDLRKSLHAILSDTTLPLN